jgi:hypothetical protein
MGLSFQEDSNDIIPKTCKTTGDKISGSSLSHQFTIRLSEVAIPTDDTKSYDRLNNTGVKQSQYKRIYINVS